MWIAQQGFAQDFFCLRLASVRNVDLGLSDRIDLARIDGAHAGAAELTLHRHVVGFDDA